MSSRAEREYISILHHRVCDNWLQQPEPNNTDLEKTILRLTTCGVPCNYHVCLTLWWEHQPWEGTDIASFILLPLTHMVLTCSSMNVPWTGPWKQLKVWWVQTVRTASLEPSESMQWRLWQVSPFQRVQTRLTSSMWLFFRTEEQDQEPWPHLGDCRGGLGNWEQQTIFSLSLIKA